MDVKTHWQQFYDQHAPEGVSWYQAEPATSLALMARAGTATDAPVIDVGGGASLLVDRLLERGFSRLAVLDVSANALTYARRRLGASAERVAWYECDVTQFDPPHAFALWHDRAVFHFLVEAADRAAYVSVLRRTLDPGAQVIIATFAPDGPERCSGLPVRRYDAGTLCTELGEDFRLQEELAETHLTPAGAEQRFRWFRLLRVTSS